MLHTKVGGSKEKPFAVLTGEVGDKISVSSMLPNLTQGGEEFQLDAGALSSWLHDGSGVAPSQINDCMVVVSEVGQGRLGQGGQSGGDDTSRECPSSFSDAPG